MAKRHATIEKALQISRILREHPHILGVELFGSVARYGCGKDLDLVLIVQESTAKRFSAEARQRYGTPIGIFWRRGSALSRYEATLATLDCEFRSLLARARRIAPGVKFDIFLYPSDWKERCEELSKEFSHKNPSFLFEIASYARTIA